MRGPVRVSLLASEPPAVVGCVLEKLFLQVWRGQELLGLAGLPLPVLTKNDLRALSNLARPCLEVASGDVKVTATSSGEAFGTMRVKLYAEMTAARQFPCSDVDAALTEVRSFAHSMGQELQADHRDCTEKMRPPVLDPPASLCVELSAPLSNREVATWFGHLFQQTLSLALQISPLRIHIASLDDTMLTFEIGPGPSDEASPHAAAQEFARQLSSDSPLARSDLAPFLAFPRLRPGLEQHFLSWLQSNQHQQPPPAPAYPSWEELFLPHGAAGERHASSRALWMCLLLPDFILFAMLDDCAGSTGHLKPGIWHAFASRCLGLGSDAASATYSFCDMHGLGAVSYRDFRRYIARVQNLRVQRMPEAPCNGAGKSTLLSIMGGKKMVPRNDCKILGKAVFHDSTLNSQRMYCGDWWRTDFFFNITVAELIGEKMLESPRVQELIDIMLLGRNARINTSWRINAISDGQRRRQISQCGQKMLQVKQSIAVPSVIPSSQDLDLYAREGLLRFLRRESEEKGATIFYATHIFDHLAEWATHLIFFSAGKMQRCCRMEDLHEFHELAKTTRCPLYALMRQWILQTYGDAADGEDLSARNLSIGALIGDIAKTPRAQHLAKVLQVYLMDEITSDLDLFAREGILNFLRAETETRGATIFYCSTA
eukprot:Skav205718  [mRNA]  locus=scaffold1496:46593:62962:+ [translate_table: standard]